MKWGGELTPAGEVHAEELGKAFRCMYPGGEGEYSSLPGSGFLRLHSTYRHDLKVSIVIMIFHIHMTCIYMYHMTRHMIGICF